MILSGGDPDAIITANMLPEEIGSNVPLPVNGGAEHLMSLPLREAREIFEREYLLAQINRFGGNISRTAEFVGMERSALHRKLRALGVSSQERAGDAAAGGPAHDAHRLRQRPLSALRAGARARRGSRLPVRRCGLRGVRGEGRPAGRRDAAHATPGPLARRARHRAADVGAAPGRACCARPSGATACATGSSTCRCRAAPARATSCSRPTTWRRPSCAWRAAFRRPELEAAAAAGIGIKTMPDIALGALRHQDGDAAAGLARQGGGAQGGGQGGLVRRRRGLRHRGRLVQCLDRRPRRPAHHPPDRQRHPARRSRAPP